MGGQGRIEAGQEPGDVWRHRARGIAESERDVADPLHAYLRRRASDTKHRDRGKRGEVIVLGRDGDAVAERGRGDPGVVTADAAAGLELGRGDPREAARGLVVDR